MLEYFKQKRAKKNVVTTDEPVLTEEDELFLQRLTLEPEGPAPELPPRPQNLLVAGESSTNEQQLILHGDAERSSTSLSDSQAGAKNVPLPKSPSPVEEVDEDGKAKGKGKGKAKKNPFGFLRRGSATKRRASEEVTSPKSPTSESQKEADDLEAVMDQLNLSAVNNRVFSVSKESREVLRKFTLVLKDVIHGVPTAYDDLEKLITNSDESLEKIYKSMPEWMQELIGKLPSKVTKGFGPEVLAAAAEKHGLKSSTLKSAASTAEKAGVKVKVPSLKELVTKQGAIVGLLRAIVTFLRTRFPAVLGVNVLWSVAITLLLLVLWYCHKRGKEVRLEKERELTEAEMEAVRSQVASEPPADYDPGQEVPSTTTAPHGASVEEVQRGIAEVQAARAAERAAEAANRDNMESSLYAPGGSLATSLRVEEEAASRRSASPVGKSR